MKVTHKSISDRVIKIEVLMENHLALHETITKWFLAPILTGTLIIFIMMAVDIIWGK